MRNLLRRVFSARSARARREYCRIAVVLDLAGVLNMQGASMAERTLPVPTHLFRWLMAPAAVWTLAATVVAVVRRRTREPTMPRMSDEWLEGLHRHPIRSADDWR